MCMAPNHYSALLTACALEKLLVNELCYGSYILRAHYCFTTCQSHYAALRSSARANNPKVTILLSAFVRARYSTVSQFHGSTVLRFHARAFCPRARLSNIFYGRSNAHVNLSDALADWLSQSAASESVGCIAVLRNPISCLERLDVR